MSEDCWTYEKDDCLGDSACKYCAGAVLIECREKADTTMIKWDATVPTCVAGKTSPAGAIVGVLIPILLIVGVWAYWVFVLNGELCRNLCAAIIAGCRVACVAQCVRTF